MKKLITLLLLCGNVVIAQSLMITELTDLRTLVMLGGMLKFITHQQMILIYQLDMLYSDGPMITQIRSLLFL